MATIKMRTDIEQSKKLAEILPLETADMCYRYYSGDMITGYGDCVLAKSFITGRNAIRENDLPCWSLAALHGILTENKICHYGDRYYCQYMSEGDEFPIYSTAEYDNPVDACYEMILKLNVFKKL